MIQHPSEEAVAEPAPSLYEASLKARAQRAAQQGRASRIVTDATLKEQAARGRITEGEPAPAAEAVASVEPDIEPPDGVADFSAPPETAESPEIYWRRRAREARWRWRLAVEQAAELEQEVDELRWEFYATDDPFYRDSQIKPAWDHALAQLELTQGNAELEQRNLDATLEEGRRAGALPGWLREGLELEPTPEALEGRGVEPEDPIGEPVEAEEPDGRSP